MSGEIKLRPTRDLLRQPVANKIFVDREPQKKLFKRIVQGKDNKLIYCFYGIGGIGKSSLLKEFMKSIEDMNGKDKKKAKSGKKQIIAVKIDFENTQFQEPAIFLLELRRQIGEQMRKFKFRVFDLAFAYYWAKAYPHIPLKEKISDLGISGLLIEISDAISQIPIASIISALSKIIKQKISNWQDRRMIKSNKFLMRYMELKEIKDLEAYLSQALSIDLGNNLREHNMKLFVFIDTYEAIWVSYGSK